MNTSLSRQPSGNPSPEASSGTDCPASRPNAPVLNLALQGGGAHGAFGWGVLDKILEDGRIDIEGFSATSAGAMNAVVYAYGKMKGGREGAREKLATFWSMVSEAGQAYSPVRTTPLDSWLNTFGLRDTLSYHMFDTITRMMSPYQFNPMNLNPLRDVLSAVVNFEELQHCRSTKVRLCATNVRTGKPKIFTNEVLTIDTVMASACLPMLFQSVHIDGEDYWDGGYIGNPAIYPLIYDSTAPDVLVVHINPIVRPGVPTAPSDIFNRINEVSFNSSLIREMRAIAFATRLIDDEWIKPEFKSRLKRIYVHAIRADEVMSEFSVSSKFQTDWTFLTRLRDFGRAAAGAWLDRHMDDIGKRSTIDIQAEYL